MGREVASGLWSLDEDLRVLAHPLAHLWRERGLLSAREFLANSLQGHPEIDHDVEDRGHLYKSAPISVAKVGVAMLRVVRVLGIHAPESPELRRAMDDESLWE